MNQKNSGQEEKGFSSRENAEAVVKKKMGGGSAASSQRYHVHPERGGEPCNVGKGKTGRVRGCPFGDLQEDHYDTREEAQEAFERKLTEEHGASATVTQEATDQELLEALEKDPNYTFINNPEEMKEHLRKERWSQAGIRHYSQYDENSPKIPLLSPRAELNGVWRDITPEEADMLSENSPFRDSLEEVLAEKYEALEFLDENLEDAWKYDRTRFGESIEGAHPDPYDLEEAGEEFLKEELIEVIDDHDLHVDDNGEVDIFQKSGVYMDDESEWQDEANLQALSQALDEAGIDYIQYDDSIRVNLKNVSDVQGSEIGELLTTIREDVVLDPALYYEIEASNR